MTIVTMRSRKPRRLLLSLLGNHVVDEHDDWIRAATFLEVLSGAGIGQATARATLDRMVVVGMLERRKDGREVAFRPTAHARRVIRGASARVHGPRPFEPTGDGWTLVTFALSEKHRHTRHRLRAALLWEGFGAVRDGLWIAPGEVDLTTALARLQPDLPDGAVVAFRAHELTSFPVAPAVADAWDLAEIRAQHELFLREWGGEPSLEQPLVDQTALVADWLTLQRTDPRLPQEFLDPDWPAPRTVEAFRTWMDALAAPAAEAFGSLVGEAVAPRRSGV